MTIAMMERIETTYKDFFDTVKNNSNDEYYIETHKGDFSKIKAAVEKQMNQMYLVKFDNGYEINCGDLHVLMDKDGNEIFVKDLVPNKRILTKFGTIAVKSICKTKDKLAYDISIDNPHWYVNDDTGIIHHNTMLGLFCIKAYLDKYKDAVCVFYDSEGGVTPDYLISNGIDPNRVIHIPIEHIEMLKFDMIKTLKELDRKDKVIIMIDSIGNTASLKELEDAENEKSVAEMQRAKSLKALFRMITPSLISKDVPCICVAHSYDTMETYSRAIISGGCMVAGTEIQTPTGLKRIEDFNVGDQVVTLDGIHDVTSTWNPETLDEGTPECYEIEFEDNYSVTVSKSHKFLIDGKWIEAKDLVVGLDCTVA